MVSSDQQENSAVRGKNQQVSWEARQVIAVATTVGAKSKKQQGKLSRSIAESYIPLEFIIAPLEKSVQ